MFLRHLLYLAVLMSSGVTVAQSGLQGFDRNYPDTPAGDNARGFTPEITPVVRPVAPPTAATGRVGTNEPSDPFTAPDPMIDGAADADQDDMPTDGS